MLTLKHHKFSGFYISRTEIIVQWNFRRFARSHEKHLLPSPCPSVCRHVSTRFPLDGILWNLINRFLRQSVEECG